MNFSNREEKKCIINARLQPFLELETAAKFGNFVAKWY